MQDKDVEFSVFWMWEFMCSVGNTSLHVLAAVRPVFSSSSRSPSSSSPSALSLRFHLQFDINQLMTSVNVSQSLSPIHKPLESPGSAGSSSHSGSGGSTGGGSVGGASGVGVEQSPVDRTKGFFPDESEPLLRCDSTSSKDSALSRNGSFITKGERVSRTTHHGRSLKALHPSAVIVLTASRDPRFQ